MSIGAHEVMLPKLWVDDFHSLKPIGFIESQCIAESEIREYHSLVSCYISEIANEECVLKVIQHNTDSILGFKRNGIPVGVYAMLHLNDMGFFYLMEGRLDFQAPDIKLLVRQGERPTAIYSWLAVTPDFGAEAFGHVNEFLQSDLYRFVDLYARPATEQGRRSLKRLGYHPVKSKTQELQQYKRSQDYNGNNPIGGR